MTRVGTSSAVMAALLVLPAGLSAAQAGATVLDEPAGSAASASAAEITPTEVTALTAERFGGTLQVTGAAAFGGQAPVLIADDQTGDGPGGAPSSDLGVDLTTATISQPDPDDPTLVFEWHVTNLPDPSSLPEAIRYTFPFKIDGKSFQPQAKYSNYASVTLLDDPAGHNRTPGDFFQLRGNCGFVTVPAPDPVGPVETTTANCPHVAWLDGEFDVTNNVIRIKVPIGAEFAPEIVPGAVVEPEAVGGSMITAAYQVVFSSPATTDNAVWEEDEFVIPGKQVMLGIAPAGTNPVFVDFATAATVADDGTFVGDLDVAGLSSGSYDVFAKACFADNCGLRIAPVTIQ